jgi:hypothetical protein
MMYTESRFRKYFKLISDALPLTLVSLAKKSLAAVEKKKEKKFSSSHFQYRKGNYDVGGEKCNFRLPG